MVKHAINSIILLEQQRISAALFYAQHITLPRSTVNILIDRLRDNFTFPYLGTTSGSSRRGGEPSWLALRSALSLISVKRFPEIKNIPDKFQVHREYQNIIYFRPCPAKSQFLNLFLRQSCLLIYNFTRQHQVSRQICPQRLPLPPSTSQ